MICFSITNRNNLSFSRYSKTSTSISISRNIFNFILYSFSNNGTETSRSGLINRSKRYSK